MSDKVKFKLSKYIIPSIISMVVVGTNANIDGFFIGNILGDDGLAAINIAWPIVAFIVSLGTGIGIGGSVIFNRMRGEGNVEKAESVKNTTLWILCLTGIVVGIILYLFCTPILKLMGAEKEVLVHAENYSKIISLGAIFQIVGAGLLVLLRNDAKTYLSMCYSLVALVLHIALNFVLAENFVMSGVALATVISQAVITVLGLVSLKIDRAHKPSFKYVSGILKDAAAPFGINFVPSMVLLFTNFYALKSGGVVAVSAYAAMSYAVYTFDYIFQGICDGIQPIISYCIGAKDIIQKRNAVKKAVIVLVSFAAFCMLITPLAIKVLPVALGISEDAFELIKRGMWIYAISYPFKASVKFICSYFYTVGKSFLSNVFVYLDPFVFTLGLLILLTEFIGIDGVWLAMPLSQIFLTIIQVIVIFIRKARTGEEIF